MTPKHDPERRSPTTPAPLPQASSDKAPPRSTAPAPRPDDDLEDYSWVRDEESLQRELGGPS